MPTHREDLLFQAAALTGGDRSAAYGDPHTNLTMMAGMVTAYLGGKYGLVRCLDSEDMAWIMVLAKASRTVASAKDDNYIDAAAYAAIAGECRRHIENYVIAPQSEA